MRDDDSTGAAESAWQRLLDYARWAPSPHNIQPWRVRVRSASEAELLYDGDRLLPDTDPSGRFSTVGLGVFVESLAIAAAADGLALDLDGDLAAPAPGAGLARFALLKLGAGGRADPLDRELLVQRRTSRLPYAGRPVDEGVLGELSGLASSLGHRLTHTSDPDLVAWVLGLNRDSLFHDMTDPSARREVGRWLRFSAAEARTARDGFSPECLGFPGWLLSLFFHHHRLLELPLLQGLVRRLYFRTMRGTRTVAWLAGPFETPADWLAAGRLLARLWLSMTAHGVQLHPFGSIVTNREANARLRERIAIDEARGTLWLIMRLGYSDDPPRSLRLETDELLVA
jgi:hypothetical protein